LQRPKWFGWDFYKEGLVMASTTIHALSYKMVADTQNFTKGIIASRSEIALMKKIMGDDSPEEKAQKALAKLQKLYDSGLISAEKYKGSVNKIEQELKQIQFAASNAGKAVAAVNSGFAKIGAVAKTGAAQLAGIAGTYLSVNTIATNIADQINRIDKIQDLAESLNTSTNSLLKMQFALQRGGGLGADEAADAMKTFSINISNAANGIGKALPTLQRLGFEADTLAALNLMQPSDQLRVVGEELSRLQAPADRLAAIVKIFGTGGDKMAAFFAGGGDAIQRMTDKAERLGISVSDIDAGGIADVVEKTEKLADAWAAFGTVIARDIYPTLTEIIKIVTRFVEATAYLYSSPDMKGQKPLEYGQQARLNSGWSAGPIQIFGYDILFGDRPTEAQAAAYREGQARRGLNALRNEVSDAPIIGKYLERLVDIGERQLEQKENRNAVE
jgi:hypothetical protein